MSPHSSPQPLGVIVPQDKGAIAPKQLAQYTHSYLKFSLGKHKALLPTHQILEVVTVPTISITPMPNMPPALLGLINQRSQVFWVTDLALLLGLPAVYPNSQQYDLILLQLNQVLLALRVQEIINIINLTPQEIGAAPAHMPANLTPYLRGCLLQADEVVLALSAEAILRAPALQPR